MVTRIKDFVAGTPIASDDIEAEIDNTNDAINDALDVTTGHDHDGVDSKTISYANLTNKPVDTNAIVFPVTGNLSVANDVAPLHHHAFETMTVTALRARVKTAPVGADLNFRVMDDGVEVASGSILDGALTYNNSATGTVAAASKLTLDITQVGSGTPGADLAVYLIYTATL